MRKIIINVNNILKYIFLIVILYPLFDVVNFEKVGITSLSFLDIVRRYGIYAVLFLLVMYIFVYLNVGLLNRDYVFWKYIIPITILYFYMSIRGFLAYGIKRQMGFMTLLSIPITLLFFYLYINNKPDNFVTIVWALNTYVILNLISVIILVKDGGWRLYNEEIGRTFGDYYFLGYDNGFVLFLLPVFCFNIILYKWKRKTVYLFFSSLCIITELYVFSAASVVAFVIMIILTSIRKSKIYNWIIKKPFVIFVFLSAMFLIFIIMGSTYLETTLIYLFNKNLSVTRWTLWQDGLSKLKGHLLFGYGYRGMTYGAGFGSPHNMILEFLLQGGILELLLYFIAISNVMNVLSSNRTAESAICYNGIISIMVSYMVEGYNNYRCFWVYLFFIMIGCMIGEYYSSMPDFSET